MIDIHSHVPTHRDVVPPDELVVNDKWRPDRPVAATTTWADYAEAFAEVDVSVAFTIARDRTLVDPALNDAVATFVADEPTRRTAGSASSRCIRRSTARWTSSSGRAATWA
jgi:hypothetical protein